MIYSILKQCVRRSIYSDPSEVSDVLVINDNLFIALEALELSCDSLLFISHSTTMASINFATRLFTKSKQVIVVDR